MKVIFLGTPDFVIQVLDTLNNNFKVVGVVCQPDSECGRGKKLTPPPTKIYATNHNIPVFQFEKIKKEGYEPLKALNADIMVTAAYGQIISQEILDLCPYPPINIHVSSLPKYRGSSPVQTALIAGEKEMGTTIMKVIYQMDAGPIICQEKINVENYDNYRDIYFKLFELGSKMVVDVINQIKSGNAIYTNQNESEATFCGKITKEMCLLQFNKPAKDIVNFIRAVNPSPVAYFNYQNQQLKVYKAEELKLKDFIELTKKFTKYEFLNAKTIQNAQNGEILISNSKLGLYIKCDDSIISIKQIQSPNGKILDIKNFLNGKAFQEGLVLC